MSQIYAYERQPYRTELSVEVIATGIAADRPFAVLDDTILYPQGGGQPADRGRLGEVDIVDVERAPEGIRHYLAAAVERRPARLRLDWPRRYDHMQQHTAQHLLTAIAADRFGWPTTSFHLQEEVCDIELDTPSLSTVQLAALETAVVAEILAARPITARRVSPAALTELAVRSRGLPEGHRGDVRLVQIEGIDLNTCGGTHLRSTGEIETLKLLGVEPMRGGVRLAWVAGARARRRLGQHEARLLELRRLLGASEDELAATAEAKLAQLKAALQRQKKLAGLLAEATADVLIARPGPVVEHHFDDTEAAFVQQIARRFASSEHRGVAFLTASGDKGHFFVVATAAGSSFAAQSLGREVAAELAARGGGSGAIFQGKATALDRRSRALALLIDLVQGAPAESAR